MIKLNNILKEVKIQLAKTPYTDYIIAANIFTKKTNIPTNLLKLKYGKYDVSRYERGYEVSWEEGKSLLNKSTKFNIDSIQSYIKDIKWEKVVIGIVPRMDDGFRSKSGFAKSFYIIGRSKKVGEIILARKETTSPKAGQTYLYIDGKKNRLIHTGYKKYPTNEVKIAKPLPNLIKNKKYKITHWDYTYNKEITNNYIFWEDLGDVLNFVIQPYGDIYEFTKSPTGDDEYDGYIIKIEEI
jgi:tetrahydromethanopterin S-methyltransferase subunit F